MLQGAGAMESGFAGILDAYRLQVFPVQYFEQVQGPFTDEPCLILIGWVIAQHVPVFLHKSSAAAGSLNDCLRPGSQARPPCSGVAVGALQPRLPSAPVVIRRPTAP